MLIHISYVASGLALLLFAMRHLTESLDREIVRYLGSGLQRMTRSSFSALLAGVAATLVVQASSVTIITTMGFLSRGLLTLDRSILIMLGAALGSALKGWYTSQIALIVGPLLLLIGAFGLVTVKDLRRRRLFEVVVSVGITFLGLQLIETGLAPIAQSKFARHLLEIKVDDGAISILKTVVVGFFLSFILQSGSSVFLLVIHFSTQGLISLPAALGLLLGANLGTTTTPLLAGMSQENADAKKLALSYCIIKLSAVALVLTYFRTHTALLEDAALFFGLEKRPELLIVAFHTWFNLMNALSWWLLLPLLLRILAWMVPGKETAVGTSPFTLGIQKLLGSLPGRALSEGTHKLQQVIRDLHWVSDSVFHVVDRRGNQAKYSELLEESLQKCERTVDVLDTVRDVAWRYLQASENSLESRKKVLSLVLLTADLKNIECVLYSCIKTLSLYSFAAAPESHTTLARFRTLREKLNSSWEKMYSLEHYNESSQKLSPDLFGKSEIDAHLLEVSIRLSAVNKLMGLNSITELVTASTQVATQLTTHSNVLKAQEIPFASSV